ncbi:hypothetical protein MNKW57_03060 [Biformimicrobium ophioploci]|uniref:Succinylglutamate desuccinylase/Aspartoacylase catalytic domain-containing protein n=1 Tax=Biformimicrobium ophioploci TaxID=3036711 RepID=A0ABQ6LV79_9GAMM|nr:hypothetical protein MNKW57_03060 [Microbulbifer sp. NKW57]
MLLATSAGHAGNPSAAAGQTPATEANAKTQAGAKAQAQSQEAPKPQSEEAAEQPATPAQAGAKAQTQAQKGTTEGLPKAQNIDLQEPIQGAELVAPDGTTADAAPAVEATPDDLVGAQPFVLLGREVPPATSTRLAWAPSQSFEGIYAATPVLVVHGKKPGPVLCLTAAIHGDELNGIETVRRVLYNLDPNKLAGTVVGVPIVNLQGFHRHSRYLSDRRDLNRFFPGDPDGSSASRIAHSFFHEVISHCDALVDLHTGSYYRTNLPQLRADLTNPGVVALTKGFGATVVLHSEGAEGTLRRAAVNQGIPAVTLEAGASMLLDETSVEHSSKAIQTLLNHMEMVSKFRLWGDPEPVYYTSTWQRAPMGGVIFSEVALGESVSKGDLLGTITNPITNVRTEIHSAYDGRVLGMALNQFVQPGFAAYHIGIRAPEEKVPAPAAAADSNASGQVSPAAEPLPDTEVPSDEQPDAPDSGDDAFEDG